MPPETNNDQPAQPVQPVVEVPPTSPAPPEQPVPQLSPQPVMAQPNPTPAPSVAPTFEGPCWYLPAGSKTLAGGRKATLSLVGSELVCVDAETRQQVFRLTLGPGTKLKVGMGYLRATEADGRQYSMMSRDNPYYVVFYSMKLSLLLSFGMYAGMFKSRKWKKTLKQAGYL